MHSASTDPAADGTRPADAREALDLERVAADPLLAEIAAMVAYLDLHIGTYPVMQLTTRQRELYCDLLDADRTLDPLGDGEPVTPARRWWRDDYTAEVPWART